jgi:zinc transport system ATP-binding protein
MEENHSQSIPKAGENPSPPPLLICRNLCLGYEGHIVVRDLDIRICAGDYACIIGENGSGKTTLMKGLLGLINPMRGRIAFSTEIRSAEIGYLSQEDAAKKDFPAGVREIVRSGAVGAMGLRPFYSRAEKRKAEEAMRRLEIADLKNRCFRELSGGQKRRVLIARALCAAQKLLALDEPTSGLDPRATAEVYKLLQEINQETGMTIIMISHDISAVQKYARSIITLGKPLLQPA